MVRAIRLSILLGGLLLGVTGLALGIWAWWISESILILLAAGATLAFTYAWHRTLADAPDEPEAPRP